MSEEDQNCGPVPNSGTLLLLHQLGKKLRKTLPMSHVEEETEISSPEEEPEDSIMQILIKNISRDCPLTITEVEKLRTLRSQLSEDNWKSLLAKARSQKSRSGNHGSVAVVFGEETSDAEGSITDGLIKQSEPSSSLPFRPATTAILQQRQPVDAVGLEPNRPLTAVPSSPGDQADCNKGYAIDKKTCSVPAAIEKSHKHMHSLSSSVPCRPSPKPIRRGNFNVATPPTSPTSKNDGAYSFEDETTTYIAHLRYAVEKKKNDALNGSNNSSKILHHTRTESGRSSADATINYSNDDTMSVSLQSADSLDHAASADQRIYTAGAELEEEEEEAEEGEEYDGDGEEQQQQPRQRQEEDEIEDEAQEYLTVEHSDIDDEIMLQQSEEGRRTSRDTIAVAVVTHVNGAVGRPRLLYAPASTINTPSGSTAAPHATPSATIPISGSSNTISSTDVSYGSRPKKAVDFGYGGDDGANLSYSFIDTTFSTANSPSPTSNKPSRGKRSPSPSPTSNKPSRGKRSPSPSPTLNKPSRGKRSPSPSPTSNKPSRGKRRDAAVGGGVKPATTGATTANTISSSTTCPDIGYHQANSSSFYPNHDNYSTDRGIGGKLRSTQEHASSQSDYNNRSYRDSDRQRQMPDKSNGDGRHGEKTTSVMMACSEEKEDYDDDNEGRSRSEDDGRWMAAAVRDDDGYYSPTRRHIINDQETSPSIARTGAGGGSLPSTCRSSSSSSFFPAQRQHTTTTAAAGHYNSTTVKVDKGRDSSHINGIKKSHSRSSSTHSNSSSRGRKNRLSVAAVAAAAESDSCYSWGGKAFDKSLGIVARICFIRGLTKTRPDFPVKIHPESNSVDVLWTESRYQQNFSNNNSTGKALRPSVAKSVAVPLRRERFTFDEIFVAESSNADRLTTLLQYRIRRALRNKRHMNFVMITPLCPSLQDGSGGDGDADHRVIGHRNIRHSKEATCNSKNANGSAASASAAAASAAIDPALTLLLGTVGGAGILSTAVTQLFLQLRGGGGGGGGAPAYKEGGEVAAEGSRSMKTAAESARTPPSDEPFQSQSHHNQHIDIGLRSWARTNSLLPPRLSRNNIADVWRSRLFLSMAVVSVPAAAAANPLLLPPQVSDLLAKQQQRKSRSSSSSSSSLVHRHADTYEINVSGLTRVEIHNPADFERVVGLVLGKRAAFRQVLQLQDSIGNANGTLNAADLSWLGLSGVTRGTRGGLKGQHATTTDADATTTALRTSDHIVAFLDVKRPFTSAGAPASAFVQTFSFVAPCGEEWYKTSDDVRFLLEAPGAGSRNNLGSTAAELGPQRQLKAPPLAAAITRRLSLSEQHDVPAVTEHLQLCFLDGAAKYFDSGSTPVKEAIGRCEIVRDSLRSISCP